MDSVDLPSDVGNDLKCLGSRIATNKGVYTVLVTLGVYKILNPAQDIRLHKALFDGGFSGRSFDTEFITPTLKEIGLPSMAESGWLTRSLEQASPYTLDYQGKITPVAVKRSFLSILDFIQRSPDSTENVLIRLLQYAIKVREENKIDIPKIENPETLTIEKIISLLDSYFSGSYSASGASKLPVIAFYAIYKSLIHELKRYEGCSLKELGSHTSPDLTSRSSGDIEIEKGDAIFESIEIKQNRLIDGNTVRIAQKKIYKFNPKRYYVLSYEGIKVDSKEEIMELISETREKHGCQIIVNGIMETLKYYLRLISSLENFIEEFKTLVSSDCELNIEHKLKLEELIIELNESTVN